MLNGSENRFKSTLVLQKIKYFHCFFWVFWQRHENGYTDYGYTEYTAIKKLIRYNGTSFKELKVMVPSPSK